MNWKQTNSVEYYRGREGSVGNSQQTFFFSLAFSSAHDTCAVPPAPSVLQFFFSKIRTSLERDSDRGQHTFPRKAFFFEWLLVLGFSPLIVTAPVEEELRMASRRWMDTKKAGLRSFSSRISPRSRESQRRRNKHEKNSVLGFDKVAKITYIFDWCQS